MWLNFGLGMYDVYISEFRFSFSRVSVQLISHKRLSAFTASQKHHILFNTLNKIALKKSILRQILAIDETFARTMRATTTIIGGGWFMHCPPQVHF